MNVILDATNHEVNEDSGLAIISESLFNQLHEEAKDQLIKVNIPSAMSEYRRGNGEGMWAFLMTEDDKEMYENNEIGKSIKVVMSNDSLFLPPICCARVIQVTLQGSNRPVLDIDWMESIIQEKAGFSFKQKLEDADND
ncbi:hypothetical protein VPHD518_0056 [Vibrio phage D518]